MHVCQWSRKNDDEEEEEATTNELQTAEILELSEKKTPHDSYTHFKCYLCN